MKNKKKIIIFIVAVGIFALVLNKSGKQQTETCISSFNNQTHPIQFNNTQSLINSSPNEIRNLNRDEMLKTVLKGYREETYWGNQHPISNKTKDLSDKEFSTFVQDDIKEKDKDVYWGAKY